MMSWNLIRPSRRFVGSIILSRRLAGHNLDSISGPWILRPQITGYTQGAVAMQREKLRSLVPDRLNSEAPQNVAETTAC
jgi:hypothetical protein